MILPLAKYGSPEGEYRVTVSPLDENGEIVAKWFKGRRINNPNTHGTGCTLSSAIAANLAKGEKLENAVEKAKDYISGALAAMLDLGKGSGPMDHAYSIN